jgi:myo-inositol 2-dehydrogenase/D-chiro-inositol 1-dehydrogenase
MEATDDRRLPSRRGFIGPLHAGNIAAHPGARLRWVVDLDPAVASKVARSIRRKRRNLDDALADPNVRSS